MKHTQRQNGFTLMEVLFAVVILAVGLIFLASQFPAGLIASRDVVEKTQNQIESHNSQVMMEVYLSMVPLNEALDRRPLDDYAGPPFPAKDLWRVHLLAKPNVLAASVYPWEYGLNPHKVEPKLVLDDLEGYLDYVIKNSGDPTSVDHPFWPYRYGDDPDYLDMFPLITPEKKWPLGLRDIGYMASPPVDQSNANVQKMLREAGVAWAYDEDFDSSGNEAYFDELDKAICQVSLESRYSWAAMYDERSSQFYIFTFRRPRNDARYAMQTLESFLRFSIWDPDLNKRGSKYGPGGMYAEYPELPRPIEPGDSGWPPPGYLGLYGDRLFPVPWRVCLPEEYWHRYDLDTIGPAAFAVPEEIADILRPGSIIIDGDPQDPDALDPDDTNNDGNIEPQTTGDSGLVYEVVEILPPGAWEDDNYYGLPGRFFGTYLVRLRTPLRDHLHYFWVFPPAVIRDTNGNFMEYEPWQPVVSVTKTYIDLK